MSKKSGKKFIKILWALLILISSATVFAAAWYIRIYGKTGFDSILFTLFGKVGGVEKGLVYSYLLNGLLPAVLTAALICFILFYTPKKVFSINIKGKKRTVYPFKGWVLTLISLVVSFVMLFTAATSVGFGKWLFYSVEKTTLYEDEYVFPEKTEIVAPENKRNLIYIYLESMETTYFDKDKGGAMDENLVSELYGLAKENVNFSQNSEVGGWTATARTNWTIASLIAQTSGMTVTTEEAGAGYTAGHLPGAVTLGDILKKEGYYQAFMVGSDATFGSRDMYYKEHGVDKVYDLFTAREDEIIPKDYYAWWGMEDKHLYRYAKQEILKLAEGDKPFAFTMLTVDTHHIGGYVCSECKNAYSEQYSNVISCASRQLGEFISWAKEQDFYENTTIIVVGDHRSMDSEYFKRNVPADYDRRMYNCVINSAVAPQNAKNRVFTPMDMFPTTLAAMGYEIKGERLALGTNLFSAEKTVAERLGKGYLDAELQKQSTFYKANFLQKKFGE